MPQSEEERRLAALEQSNDFYNAACRLMSESDDRRALQLLQSCLQVSDSGETTCMQDVWPYIQRRVACVALKYSEP